MSPLMNYTRRRKVKNIILDLLIALVVIICVFPFIWMFMTSIKTRVQTIDPSIWFSNPLSKTIGQYFKNGICLCISTIVSLWCYLLPWFL